MFAEYNYKNTVKEGIDTDAMDFLPIKNFVGQEIRVDGFFFTEGRFGQQVVVVGNGYKINMPPRCVPIFQKIANDPEQLKAVLAGHLKLTAIKMKETKNKPTTIFDFADC
nr:MAG TPA: hypothetical protein [Caudoviricetes sp.]